MAVIRFKVNSKDSDMEFATGNNWAFHKLKVSEVTAEKKTRN